MKSCGGHRWYVEQTIHTRIRTLIPRGNFIRVARREFNGTAGANIEGVGQGEKEGEGAHTYKTARYVREESPQNPKTHFGDATPRIGRGGGGGKYRAM